MVHLDLFSGIGGFAYAVDQVWPGSEHIFCDNDPFCRQVLAKHWPGSKIHHDIRQLIADTQRREDHAEHEGSGRPGKRQGRTVETGPETSRQANGAAGHVDGGRQLAGGVDLVTGGFPCQPFSQAGSRRGTDDDRYLWPEMLEVIRLTKPSWVIAENVSGILTWDEGMVFEQVCADLEGAGYEVQPLVIPAAAVGAPHRRDRVWFVAHAGGAGAKRTSRTAPNKGRVPGQGGRKSVRQENGAAGAGRPRTADKHAEALPTHPKGNDAGGNTGKLPEAYEQQTPERPKGRDAEPSGAGGLNAQDTYGWGARRRDDPARLGPVGHTGGQVQDAGPGWSSDWLEIATALCSMDDGLPVRLDGFELTKSKHRAEQLKAYGNAIVPQVAVEIMRGMAL